MNTHTMLIDLLEHVLKKPVWVGISALSDQDVNTLVPYIRNRVIPVSHVAKLNMGNLGEWNRLGYGIHWGQTTKKAPAPELNKRNRREDTAYVSHLWIDIDNPKSPQDALEALLNDKHAPTYVIHSGGGIHAYYKLTAPLDLREADDAQLRDVERVIEGLVFHWDADLNCRELSRTLRLPGLINMKPKRNGAPCQIIYADEGHALPFEAFRERFYELGADRTPRPFDYTPNEDGSMPRYLADYLCTPQASGERNATMFKMVTFAIKAGFFDENDFMGRGMADGMHEREIRGIIASALRTV
jgi:hypothetical protein